MADVAREAANEIVDRLDALGLAESGTVHVEPVSTWISRAGLDAERRTPGSSADAVYARSRVVRNQTAAQLRALELQVATDVTNAALQAESSLKRYEAANVARELAETRLSAEQSRFEVGLSTNFFVVQAQRDLATAQNTELRALLDYRRAIVDYGRVQEAPATRGGSVVSTVNAGAVN